MERQLIDVEDLEAKAKVYFEDPYQSMKATAYIRYKKDSMIWFSVKKLAIEGARALITKDSVFVINRLDKTYVAKDLDYLQNNFGLPADFDYIQSILLGNPVFVTEENLTTDIDKMNYYLSAEDGTYNSQYWINGMSYLISQMIFEDKKNLRDVKLSFDDYKPLDNQQNFAHERMLAMNSSETGSISIDIKFTKIKINTDKEIKFEIPSHYTEMQ